VIRELFGGFAERVFVDGVVGKAQLAHGLEFPNFSSVLRVVEGRHLGEQCPRVGGDGDRRVVDYGDGVGIAHTYDSTPITVTRQGQSGSIRTNLGLGCHGLSEPFLNVFTW